MTAPNRLTSIASLGVLLVACSSDKTPSGSDAGTRRGTADAAIATKPDGAAHTPTITGVLDVNGAHLYYEERGTGSAVILLHGFTLDTRMWDSQFDALSAKHRVIRFDMRGHGKSSGAGPDDAGAAISFSQSEDVLGVLDALHADKAHIVGLSMGGYVAYEFVVDHPGRALSLTVIDSGWRYDSTLTSDFQMRLVGYLGTADLETGLRAWMADPLFVPASKIPAVKSALEDIVLKGQLALGARSYFKNPASAVPPSPLAETRFGEIEVPTLVLVGELDDPEFVAHADAIATGIAGAKKTVIAGSGHMSTMEKPDMVDMALTAFIDAH